MEQTIVIVTTLVNLLRYNGQASEFELVRTIKVPSDQIDTTVDSFSANRGSVKNFYKYTWTRQDGGTGELYCVSPFVFDEVEISQI